MKFTFIAGAMGALEHDGCRILFDPWLDDGIFHGAWYHYPPARVSIDELGRFDYVFISHIHEDHCSPGTLRCIDRDTHLLVADRKPNLVLKFLEREGLTFSSVTAVPPFTPTKLAPGLVVDIVTADPDHWLNYAIDSAIVLSWDGHVVYNANDCPPYAGGISYVRETYGHVDLALLPYASGSSYPACYDNLTHDEKLAERDRLRQRDREVFVADVQALTPTHVAPFADQYVVAGSRGHLNQYLPHPPGFAPVRDALADAGLGDVGLFLNSGQTFDLATAEVTPDESFVEHTEEDRDRYLATLADRARYDHERLSLGRSVPLERLVAAARTRLWAEQERQAWFPELSYVLDVADEDRRFVIRLDNREITETSDTPASPPYLAIRGSRTLLVLLLLGHISWNIADAALFLDFDRVPNDYDPRVHANLNHLRV